MQGLSLFIWEYIHSLIQLVFKSETPKLFPIVLEKRACQHSLWGVYVPVGLLTQVDLCVWGVQQFLSVQAGQKDVEPHLHLLLPRPRGTTEEGKGRHSNWIFQGGSWHKVPSTLSHTREEKPPTHM